MKNLEVARLKRQLMTKFNEYQEVDELHKLSRIMSAQVELVQINVHLLVLGYHSQNLIFQSIFQKNTHSSNNMQ